LWYGRGGFLCDGKYWIPAGAGMTRKDLDSSRSWNDEKRPGFQPALE